MNIILLGPPGAGKGTIASGLKEHLNLPHISTGDLFRFHMNNNTDLGRHVKEIIDSGALVPDEITIEMLKLRLDENDTGKGIILDGFPRTIGQAEALNGLLTVQIVINLQLSNNEVIKRLSGRRLCKDCGKGYHILFMPPRTEWVCDTCGGRLYIRDDDKEDAILNRLEVYKKQTEPLIEYYTGKGLIKHIDASPSPDYVLAGSLDIIHKIEINT